jgi:hypothetical protein
MEDGRDASMARLGREENHQSKIGIPLVVL